MKKKLNSIFLSSLIILLFLSCKKEEIVEVPASYLYYELDGQPYSITSKTDLTFYFGGTIQTVGEEQPTSNLYLKSPKLNITVRDHEAVIQPGTYSGKTYYPSGYTKEVIFDLIHTDNIGYQSDYVNPVTSVTIFNISRNGVKGTFNGHVVNNAMMDTVYITNGEFAIYNYKY